MTPNPDQALAAGRRTPARKPAGAERSIGVAGSSSVAPPRPGRGSAARSDTPVDRVDRGRSAAPDSRVPDTHAPDTDARATGPLRGAGRTANPFAAIGRAAVVALVLLVLTPLVAYALAAQGSPQYGARAEVVYAGTDQVAQRADQQLRTQSVVLASRPVLTPAARQMHLAVSDLQDRVTVSQLDASDVLRVGVTADSRQAALQAAQRIADTYVSMTRRQVTSQAQRQSLLTTRLAALQKRQAKARAKVARLSAGAGIDPTPSMAARIATAQDDARAAAEQVTSLQTQITQAQVDGLTDTPTVRVLTDAYVLDDPVAPKPWRAAAAGLLVGVLLAGATVLYLLRASARK